MEVVAKMRVTSITQSGDARKPCVRVSLGAVYSSDPESENRSFANATPNASVELSIDAGRPAAEAFHLQEEFYVTFRSAGVVERFYVRDISPAADGEYQLETRDKAKIQRTVYEAKAQEWVMPDGKRVRGWNEDGLVALGWTHWRHLAGGQ